MVPVLGTLSRFLLMTYIFCDQDHAVLPFVQDQMVADLNAKGANVAETQLNTSEALFLSQPQLPTKTREALSR